MLVYQRVDFLRGWKKTSKKRQVGAGNWESGRVWSGECWGRKETAKSGDPITIATMYYHIHNYHIDYCILYIYIYIYYNSTILL